jgi:hypothetical protein
MFFYWKSLEGAPAPVMSPVVYSTFESARDADHEPESGRQSAAQSEAVSRICRRKP